MSAAHWVVPIHPHHEEPYSWLVAKAWPPFVPPQTKDADWREPAPPFPASQDEDWKQSEDVVLLELWNAHYSLLRWEREPETKD